MIRPKIYLEASIKVLEDNECACSAILSCKLPATEYRMHESKEVDLFAHLFRPEDKSSHNFWFGVRLYGEEQEDRATALLLMYEIAKDIKKEYKKG